MAFHDRAEALPQPGRDLLYQVDGAVLAACTANGHAEVAAVVLVIARYPADQEVVNIIALFMHRVLTLEEFNHIIVQAGLVTQAGFPVRVGQATHIKYKIRI